MDAALYPDDAQDALQFLEPYVVRLRDGYTGTGKNWLEGKGTFPDCSAPNMTSNIAIFGDWLDNAFMYGPILSSLIVGDASTDQYLIDDAGDLLSAPLPESYFPRCWALLGNLMLNGAMERAGKLLSE
jgi:hypothetical protein